MILNSTDKRHTGVVYGRCPNVRARIGRSLLFTNKLQQRLRKRFGTEEVGQVVPHKICKRPSGDTEQTCGVCVCVCVCVCREGRIEEGGNM